MTRREVEVEVERRAGGIRAAADLAALARDCVSANAPRVVLHLRLAEIGHWRHRPFHQRQVRDALEPVLATARTRRFDLPNGDIMVVAPPPALGLEVARQTLQRVLDTAAERALRMLRLPEAAAELLGIITDSLGLEPGEPPPAAPAARLPITSLHVASAERALANADLESVTLAQGVCRIDPDGAPVQLLWEDRRISWPALADLVLPGVDIAASAALQRRLARLAEQRMLAEIGRPSAQMGWRPLGLPLTPATVTAAGFLRFDASLAAGRRKEVTVAFRPSDLLADPPAFDAARRFARERGFLVALDDSPIDLLAALPPARLGLDLVRLRWTPALPAVPAAALAPLADWPAGAEGVVLVGVDRPAAVAWGWEVGIRLFQGPLVERRRGA